MNGDEITDQFEKIKQMIINANEKRELERVVHELTRLKQDSKFLSQEKVTYIRTMGGRIIMYLDEKLDPLCREERRSILDQLGKLDSFYF